MADGTYGQLMETIKHAAARLFEYAENEEEVHRIEAAIKHEVSYLAAIAQSEHVKPADGWDPFGR